MSRLPARKGAGFIRCLGARHARNQMSLLTAACGSIRHRYRFGSETVFQIAHRLGHLGVTAQSRWAREERISSSEPNQTETDMKTIIAALLATIALGTAAEANVIRDLATTGSVITVHGVFDGR